MSGKEWPHPHRDLGDDGDDDHNNDKDNELCALDTSHPLSDIFVTNSCSGFAVRSPVMGAWPGGASFHVNVEVTHLRTQRMLCKPELELGARNRLAQDMNEQSSESIAHSFGVLWELAGWKTSYLDLGDQDCVPTTDPRVRMIITAAGKEISPKWFSVRLALSIKWE